MKLYAFLICLILVGSGCSDWLDVKPRSESREDEHYSYEDGFKSTLTGVYIRMASASLYGKNMTMLVPELLAQHWKTSSTAGSGKYYNDLASYKYSETEVENMLAEVWREYYKAIANLNNLLTAIDDRQGVFTSGNYELIKGEALGLRAFLHFDLLRLFGPVPTEETKEEISIPYVKEVTKVIDQLLSLPYSKVMECILDDLNQAEKLLVNDPLVEYDNEFLNEPKNDGGDALDEFHYYRQYRFNLYAVKAVKARVLLWDGKKQEAGQLARAVIASEKFRLGQNSDLTTINSEDRTFTREHIFAIHNPKLESIVTPLFRSGNNVLERPQNVVDITFEKNLNPEDIRVAGTCYWESRTVTSSGTITKYCYKKYYQDEESDPDLTQVVPLVRLSEMYLIAMECSTPEDALPLFKEFRISRKMNASLDAGFSGYQNLMNRVESEYRKEFFAEGQMFFFCKRLNKEKIMGQKGGYGITMNKDTYVLPKPDGQVVFE